LQNPNDTCDCVIGNAAATAEQRQAERTFVGRKCGNVGLTVHARGTDDSKYWNCTAIPSKAAAQYFIIKTDSAP